MPAKTQKVYRLTCSEAHLQHFHQHSVALQGRSADGKVLKGDEGRVRCTLNITSGPFKVYDHQGLNPVPFQLIRGVPPELAEAVRSGRVIAEAVGDDELQSLDGGQIFDPQEMKPERIQ